MVSLCFKSLRFTAFNDVRSGVPQLIAEPVAFQSTQASFDYLCHTNAAFLRGWHFPRRQKQLGVQSYAYLASS